MIEQDINERMAGIAPSQNVGEDPAILAIKRNRGMLLPTENQAPMSDVAQPTVELPQEPDYAARAILEDRRNRMMSSVYTASKVDPERAAKAQKLSAETGIGSGIALRHLDEMMVDARMREIERKNYFAENPVLANSLSDPEFAAVAQDDLGTLDRIGGFFGELAMFSRYGFSPSTLKGTARGMAMVERGQIGAAAAAGLATPQDIDRAEQLRQDMTKLQGGGLLAATAEVVTQQIANLKQTATIAAGGAAVGSAVPGVGTAAGGALGFAAGTITSTAQMEGGNAYLDMRADGVPDDVAIPAAIAVGFLNGAIEVYGLKLAASPFKGLAKKAMAEATAEALAKPSVRSALAIAGKEYVKQVGGEGVEEALQQTVSVIGDRIAKAASGMEYEGSLKKDLGQIIESFGQGALASVLLGGIGPGANLVYDLNRAEAAVGTQQFLQNLTTAVKEGTLKPRSPMMLERYIQAQAERYGVGDFYIAGTVMRDVINASGITPEQLEQVLPGMGEQVRGALLNNGDVNLTPGQYAATIAGTKFGDALMPHIRVGDPRAVSYAQAQQINANREQMREDATKIIGDMERTDTAFVESARNVENAYRDQIERTGRPREEAEAAAMFVRDFYVVLGASMGQTPEQVQQRFPYRVEGQAAAVAEPLEQAARQAYPSLAKAWDRYNSGESLMTVGDLADKIDSLDLAGKRIPQSVLDAVQEFRNAQREERELYGERGGTEDDAGNALEIAVQNAAEQLREASPNIMEQAATMDAEYLAAVERGDMDAAQRMVDAAAKAAGIMFRGHKRGRPQGLTETFVSQSREQAQQFANQHADGIVSLVRFSRPIRVYEQPIPWQEYQDSWRNSVLLKGYDAVRIIEPNGQDISLAIRNPSVIEFESADPVTRDEAGNIIPLSRRFDITSPRIFEQAAMSTRVPSAKGMEMAALDGMLLADWDAMKDNEKLIAGNLAKIKELGFPVKLDETKTPREKLEQFMEAVADNLDYLYEQMEPTQRERAKMWYVGGRRIVEWLAARYGITDMQAAAMLAVLSPQKNWFENVSMADRIGDILTSARNEPWSPEMEKNFRRMVEDVRARVTITERQIADNEKPEKPTKPRTEESLEDFKARKKSFDARRPRLKAKYERDLAQWEQELEEYEVELAELQESGESTTMIRADMAAHRRERPKSPRMPGRVLAESAVEFAARNEQYQKDLAEWEKRGTRLAKILKSKQDRIKYLDDLSASPRMQAMREGTLQTVLASKDLELAGMFVRMFDEEHNDRTFAIITPEGGMAGPSMGASGPMSMRWGSYSTIQKAISVYEDGRAENVHHQIGKAHKVRNFYNNLFDPTNVNAATIDTHAIAAGALMPLSASDDIVGWGLGAGVSDAKLGLHGGYPILFEAYRRAAARRGIIAREEQSITWEAIRGLFVAAEKKTLKPIIAEVWGRYMKGDISLEDARAQVFKLAGGIKTPEWVAQPADLPVGSTYSGRSRSLMDAMTPAIQQQMQQMTRLMFEIAPDLRDEKLSAAWKALPMEIRHAISRSVMAKIVPKILKEYGVTAAIEEQIGGWEGGTELSFAMSLPSTTLVRQISQALREVLSQKAIFSISEQKFEGASRAGLVVIDLQPGTTPEQITELYEKRLYQVTKLGHSTVGSSMVIGLNEGVDSGELARRIDAELGNDPLIVRIKHGEAWSLYDESPEQTVEGAAVDERGPARVDERRRLDALREQATELIVKELRAAGLYEQAARGPARGFIDPKTLIATITQGGDLATLIHESAHAFLVIYGRIAQQPDAPAFIKADMDTVLRWGNVPGDTPEARLATWSNMTVDEQRTLHESFAYNFEIYAWEGKAPSAELRGVFQRFRAYLTRLYKSIRDDLNAIYRREFGTDLPILTPEVRAVMDRMLASERQIKQYQAINSMAPYFQTQEEAQMDDATWAAYVAMNQEAEDQAIADLTKASLGQVDWIRRARISAEREEERGMAARRREVKDEATQEVRGRLVYRLQDYLRTGRYRDEAGEEITVEGPHRLSVDRIEALYTGIPTAESVEAIRATGMAVPAVLQPEWRRLGFGKSGMLVKEGGVDPEMVAETFGYPGGDAMIRALVDAPKFSEAVEARTNELMQERYGEMDSPEAREQRISEAIHNEARARLVAVELRHASRATEPVAVMLEAARIAAQDILARKRLRDIRPQDHEAAEARAARDAINARRAAGNPAAAAQAAYTRAKNAVLKAPREDTVEALLAATEAAEVAGEAARAESMARSAERIGRFVEEYGNVQPDLLVIRAKRAQLYQNQLAAEARKAKAYVEKQVKYLRKVLRDENRKRMGAGYADQIEALLANVNLVAMSAVQRQQLADLGEWLKKMEADGVKPDISEDLAKAAFRVPYKDLTLDQFRELVEAVRTIEYMGKNEQKVLLEKQKAEFKEKEAAIVKNAEAVARSRGRIEKLRRSGQTRAAKASAKLRGFFAAGLKAWAIVEVIDGGPGGPLWEYLIRTANDRADMETEMNAAATKRLTEILEPWYRVGNMMAGKVEFPSIGRSMTREARLAIALNYGNAGNIQRLLDGEGWTQEQVQPVLESLTAEEWDAVQQVWDFMDEYRPLIAAKERRLFGKEPNWVEPQELTVRTVDGKVKTLLGGYYPIVYDPVAAFRSEKQSEVDTAEAQLKGAFTAATTRRTFTKERAAKVEDRPLLYSLQGLWSGVTDVIHDLSWHEWLIDANRLMRSEEFDRVVRARYGEQPKLELRRWIEDVAAGGRGALTPGMMAAAFMRQNVSVAGLGYSVRTALINLTGLALSIARHGWSPILRGATVFAMNPLDTMRRVNSMSKFMASRSRTQFRDLNEIRNRVAGEQGWRRGIASHAYTLTLVTQRLVDIPTWLAGYENAIADGKDEDTAIALADQGVIATQGSGLLKDLSRVEREKGLASLFTVFYSYFNTVFNLATVQTMTARSRGKAAHDLLMILVVPVMVEQLLKEVLTPDGDDKEEKDLGKVAAQLTRAEVEYLLGMFVYVRELQGVSGMIDGGMRGYEGPAGLRGIVTIQRAAQQAGQGEFDRGFRRSAVDLLGIGLGLPSAQINRTIDGLEALSEGETENPLSAVMGVQRR